MTDSDLAPAPRFVAVIPAGGVGSRLWPLSRPDRPKFLIDLLGRGATLLQETVSRLAPLSDRVVIVTGARHRAAVLDQVPGVDPADVLAEPSPRDSMAAIALAAAVVEHRWGPAIMGSFAADQTIADDDAFAAAVATAIAAAEGGDIVTIGIEPTQPSTAYGYIEVGEPLASPVGAYRVAAFTEKPDAATATDMLARGGFAWNAGMFVAQTSVLLGHLDRRQPTLAAGVRDIARAWDMPEREETLARVWPTLTRISIDHALAEPVAAEGGVAVVPASLGWYDVGDFATLADVSEPDDQGVIRVAHDGPIIAVDAERPVVVGGAGRTVAVVGFDDAVVAVTDDAILVLRRDLAQRVKDVADRA